MEAMLLIDSIVWRISDTVGHISGRLIEIRGVVEVKNPIRLHLLIIFLRYIVLSTHVDSRIMSYRYGESPRRPTPVYNPPPMDFCAFNLKR